MGLDEGGRIAEVSKIDEDVIQVSIQKSVNNVREVSDYVPYGIDCLPETGAKVALFNLGSKAYKLMMGIKRKVTDRIAKPGETRLYSKTGSQVYLDENDDVIIETDGGAIITCKANGKVELNGNTKSSMTFDDFETIWNLFIVHMDAHIHTDPVSGTTGPPTVPSGAAGDMSTAENDRVLM